MIKCLCLKTKTNGPIKHDLIEVYGNSAPSLSAIKFLTAEFKRGPISVFNGEQAKTIGIPKEKGQNI